MSTRIFSIPRVSFFFIMLVLGLFCLTIFVPSFADAAGPALMRTAPGKIHHGIKNLPKSVRTTVLAIHGAARSGDINALREVLDMNELAPMIAKHHVADPIKFWKSQSTDGTGHDILARLINILESGYVVVKHDRFDTLYLWPYFSDISLGKLTPGQKVQLYRLLPAKQAASALKSGKYTGFRLGIGKDGTWHFFTKRDEK